MIEKIAIRDAWIIMMSLVVGSLMVPLIWTVTMIDPIILSIVSYIIVPIALVLDRFYGKLEHRRMNKVHQEGALFASPPYTTTEDYR